MLLKLPCNVSDDFLMRFTNLSYGWVLGVKVYTGKDIHKWVREGEGHWYLLYFIKYFIKFVMLSLGVHLG